MAFRPVIAHALRRTVVPVLALMLAPVPADAAASKPERIVSMNVCTDQYLLLLVEPGRIASVSYLAIDPQVSMLAAEARGLHTNRGITEQIIPLDPDLVLAAHFSATAAVNMLTRLGYRVVVVEPESTLADFPRNLRIIADAVGERDRAEQIISAYQRRLKDLRRHASDRRLVFADYSVNGRTSGRGTMVADIAAQAGLVSLGETLGFAGNQFVALEQFLAARPDIIALGRAWDDPPAVASASLRHPALRYLLSRTRTIEVAGPYWVCGSFYTLDVLQWLVDALPAKAMP